MNSPTTSSARVSTTISSERSGSRRPLVSVATVRMRWRARSTSWCEVGPADLELLAVADPGLRGDDDPGAAQVDPPAQLDVVAVEADRRVEAAEGPEQVGPHEQAGRRERRTRRGRASCCSWSYSPGSVIGSTSPKRSRPRPTCCSTRRVVPRHQLRADDAGVRSVQLLDEHAHGVGVERHVVVAEAEEPAVALDQAQHLVGGRAEAGVGAELADEGVGQPGEDPPPTRTSPSASTRGEQEQRVEVRVVLGGERGQRLVEPGSGVVDDDDRDDRRRERRVGRRSPRWTRGYRRWLRGLSSPDLVIVR